MLPDFAAPGWFAILILIFLIIITGRYFLFAGIFYLVFYIWFPKKWAGRKISHRNYQKGQLKTEMKWSVITSFLFSIAGAMTVILWQKGLTKVYTDPLLYGWWYLPVSLLVFMGAQMDAFARSFQDRSQGAS
jgi:lathosterol oxidase